MTAQILNVALVLMGIYIALSITCSFLQEQLAAVLQLRPKALARGLAELVSRDPGVVEFISAHPLIADAPSDGAGKADPHLPSYIDPRNFSLAFWQVVAAAANPASPVAKAVADPREAFASLLASINAWSPETSTSKRVRQSAIGLLTAAEGDYDRLMIATDAWFNAKMQRVSGWYKRNAQYIMIGIAFVLAFGSGIDSIDLGRQLFAAPAFTQATAQSITAAVDIHKQDTDGGVNDVANIIAAAQAKEQLHLSRWSGGPRFDLEALLGILITAIAVSLGSPFWFDVLKGIVNVRMAGEKPDNAAPTAPPQPAPAAITPVPATEYLGTIKSVDNGATVPTS